jgi:hypothetical protein
MSSTEEEIASDLLAYLRANPGVCANGNVHGWAWIRFHDGAWQATRYYRGGDRLSSYIVGDVLDENAVMDWLITKPVTLIPGSEAYLCSPPTVWKEAAQQDVFTSLDRCFWCGHSERSHDLQPYQTTEDGECLLCADCYESWESAGEIVAKQQEATA